jgi:hypothetical protein
VEGLVMFTPKVAGRIGTGGVGFVGFKGE